MRFSRILINYVTRYFFGFLIIFLCSIFVSLAANKSIENYIIERGEIKNREGIDTIHDVISKMDFMSQVMLKNKTFTNIVYQRGQIPQNDVLKLREANQMFTEIGFAADYIPYMFMLFLNNDLYLSTGQCSFRFQDYYRQFLDIRRQGDDLYEAGLVREFLLSRFTSRNQFIKADSIRFVYNEKEQVLDQPLLYVTSSNYFSNRSIYRSGFVRLVSVGLGAWR